MILLFTCGKYLLAEIGNSRVSITDLIESPLGVIQSGFSAQTVKEASMVLRGHRSIVNQVRFNRTNHMIVSSGVEKIIKVMSYGIDDNFVRLIIDVIQLWSPWRLPECSGDTETVGVSSRDVYTHEEYITMVIRSGIALPHDNDTSTAEDVRMLAFFDSLVQVSFGCEMSTLIHF